MKIDDQKAFLDLAKSLGYDDLGVSAPNAMMPGQGSTLTQNPDGSVTATETTNMTLVKKTVYPKV